MDYFLSEVLTTCNKRWQLVLLQVALTMLSEGRCGKAFGD
jgi:hypothetical protein